MTDPLRVELISFSSAAPELKATGLLGWVRCALNGRLELDGLALRRTDGGRFYVSFPERADSAGRRHALVRPLDDEARRDIEAQILAASGLVQPGEQAG